jgi:hypothetical protein
MSALGLTGTATGFHIHAAAPAGSNAGVVVNLANAPFVSFNSGGTLLVGGSNATPPANFLANLQASLAYVNVHTAAFPGGEIRGQLIPVATVVPEPSTYALLLAGLGFVGFLAQRRRMN